MDGDKNTVISTCLTHISVQHLSKWILVQTRLTRALKRLGLLSTYLGKLYISEEA